MNKEEKVPMKWAIFEDGRLNEHFTLAELTRSATASTHGIDNTPGEQEVANLAALCQNVLEPLRRAAGRPVVVSSGYRCEELNPLVCGAPGSQHLRGQAADVRFQGFTPTVSGVYLWLHSLPVFDQAIIYRDRAGGFRFLHISYVTNPAQCRRQIVLKTV